MTSPSQQQLLNLKINLCKALSSDFYSNLDHQTDEGSVSKNYYF